MSPSQPLEAPSFSSLPQAVPPNCRIAIPLHRVLGFARRESGSRPSRRLGFAMRPLLSLALETTGLCPGLPATPVPLPDRRAGKGSAADPEILFTALSSLVEVVKSLTPSAGRVYAQLGHQAVPATDLSDTAWREPRERGLAAAAPRSEVVIELVSTVSSTAASFSPAILDDLGGLAFELAVVAAVVESKGGELCLGQAGVDRRSFVVRLPVLSHGSRRAAAASG
jgi:hypothetical protein